MSLDWAVAFEDFRAMARARLPRILFDYIDGGSYGEVTIRRNAEELDRVILPQRVMRYMREVSTATRLLGQELAMPVVLGPVGFAGMFARRGEVQAARAALAAGCPSPCRPSAYAAPRRSRGRPGSRPSSNSTWSRIAC